MNTSQIPTPPVEVDPAETTEWLDAFAALVATQGPERARFVLDQLVRAANTA